MKKSKIQEGLETLVENFDVPPEIVSEILNSYDRVYDSDKFSTRLLTKYMRKLSNYRTNGNNARGK